MKINKTELIEILSIKTGLEKDEVKDQLQELIKRIKDAASRGKALEIKGFGVFYFDDDKNLRFDPADSFRTEVNFKYTGMEPVEVKPPRDTSVDTSDPEEMPDPDEDVFGLDEDDEVKPVTEPEADIETDQPDQDKPVFAEETDETEKPEKELSSSFQFDSEEKDEDSFNYLFGADDEEIAEPVPEEELKKSGTLPATSDDPLPGKADEKKKRDPVIMVLSIVLVIVVLVSGFFIISDMMDTPPQQEPTAEMPVEQPPVEAEQDVTETVEPEPEDDVQVVDEPAAPAADEQEIYGLTGELVSQANDGFTIVLYSMRNIGNARAASERLSDDGYRTMVTERSVDGQPVYRVSVGQFESINSAQQQANSLPEPYRNQNFIQRIQ